MKPILTILVLIIASVNAMSQTTQYVRIAKLVIDSSKLEPYKTALKEHAEAAVRVEPGVLMLYAVYEKDNPAHVSVFEIYADQEAYQKHIKSPHFLKYKTTVQDMVKSLELVDVTPISLQAKEKIAN